MILSMLLTIVFGFGVITLATIALLNVAGLRIHDLRVEKRKKEKGKRKEPVVVYVYTSQSARDLRISVSKLPSRLKWGAIIAVSFVVVLYTLVDSALPSTMIERPIEAALLGGEPTKDAYASRVDTAEHLRPVSIITWAPIAGYVLVLLIVAGSISKRCYVVLKEVVPANSGRKR